MYEDLHVKQGMGRSRALEIIGKQFGVSRQTVMCHPCTYYKQKQKNFQSRRWAYERKDAEIHKKRTNYNSRYITSRDPVDGLVRQSYKRVTPKEEMILEELSETICKISGVCFHPNTIS